MPTLDEARGWYSSDDPVHGFDHILRVLRLAERLATELKADLEIVRAAALLHDSSGAAPGGEGGRDRHEQASAEFAGEVLVREGWPEDKIRAVQHAIRAHRFRSSEPPSSLEAKVIFDADKLDVVGAFGVVRTILFALQASQPVFAEPSQQFIERGKELPEEPHSAYHEYLFKLQKVLDRLQTEPARRVAREREKVLRSFFEQLASEARGQG